MTTYPIVGLKYVSKNSADRDWDFIVRVLSCVWTSDHKSVIVYEWQDEEGVCIVGLDSIEVFNDRFDRYREV